MSTVAGVHPPLRLGQRDDGMGPFCHARLGGSTPAGPTSVQLGTAPRVGPSSGRYA